MKIILTGGGTAGHIWPLVTVAENLKKNGRVKFIYIGSRQGPERKISREFDIPFRTILVGKWRPYFSISNFWDLFKTFIGLIQSYFIIAIFKPDVVLAKGGYVTFPVLFWVKAFKIPLVLHESDVIMGKANRWASGFAKKICVGFPIKNYDNLPLEKLVFVNIPVRREFFSAPSVPNERKTLLVTGGSQGAHKINDIIFSILSDLIEKYEVYHLSGEKDYDKFFKSEFMKNSHYQTNSHYHLESFSNDMPKLISNSDLIVSRAGATTFTEIGAAQKAAILIPLPTASSDHQSANAQVYEKASAAVVVSEKNLTSGSLLSIINRLMEDDNFRQILGHHAAQFADPKATEQIVDILFEVSDGK